MSCRSAARLGCEYDFFLNGVPGAVDPRAGLGGIGGFGALFAAEWAMSKVYKRKSAGCPR